MRLQSHQRPQSGTHEAEEVPRMTLKGRNWFHKIIRKKHWKSLRNHWNSSEHHWHVQVYRQNSKGFLKLGSQKNMSLSFMLPYTKKVFSVAGSQSIALWRWEPQNPRSPICWHNHWMDHQPECAQDVTGIQQEIIRCHWKNVGFQQEVIGVQCECWFSLRNCFG